MAGLNLDDLERKVLHLGDLAVDIIKEEVDKGSEKFLEKIESTIPTRSGELARQIDKKQIKFKDDSKYGWSIIFGYQPVPNVGKGSKDFTYHDLAFWLNHYGYIRLGSSEIAEIRKQGFIYNAVSGLVEINKNINERWRKEVDNPSKQ